ncbi:AsnC family protein [Amycolatopsis viridis]|uniref:DNA-binding Lrp family transcriptional regulator n=1 Tax=Amycolatopsis viridis TaxID=185678 RepID=A0ABX0SXR8_9PSEU|nr:AsnC family protein [Amycolatopsis viridis]NIH81189.1 DNA-binding Lrp family transcriptional regulator [Amycolatopsis viridis]
MAVTDPADARLLAALADLGKVAVHELAARIGMDPREAAYRLVALSGSGLPLLVGVESDPQGLRAALAGAFPPPRHPVPGVPRGPSPVPSGAVPAAGYPAPAPPAPPLAHPPSGPTGFSGPPAGMPGPHGVPSGPYPAPGADQRPAPPPLDPVISTWGPPQTASWARGDAQPAPAPGPRSGRVGDRLAGQGLDGEQLAVQLLEVQDPADYLFGAAGYRLQPGERAVVVHTEVTNTGPVPFRSLPDNYLELLTATGAAIAKAPVSLTSRPPHRIGVQPGETAGGHTVYVVPESARVVAVRWSPRPEPDARSLTWSLED